MPYRHEALHKGQRKPLLSFYSTFCSRMWHVPFILPLHTLPRARQKLTVETELPKSV